MSISYVSAELRRLIVSRAESLCEYCLIAEDDTGFGCAVDHVISEKHCGPTDADNLAYACVFCNQAKGSDVGSIHWETGEFVRFFNPRRDRWADHFVLRGNMIDSRTAIGAATARILGFNVTERAEERQLLRDIGRYPSVAALRRMQA
jgi:hypothetical protein